MDKKMIDKILSQRARSIGYIEGTLKGLAVLSGKTTKDSGVALALDCLNSLFQEQRYYYLLLNKLLKLKQTGR